MNQAGYTTMAILRLLCPGGVVEAEDYEDMLLIAGIVDKQALKQAEKEAWGGNANGPAAPGPCTGPRDSAASPTSAKTTTNGSEPDAPKPSRQPWNSCDGTGAAAASSAKGSAGRAEDGSGVYDGIGSCLSHSFKLWMRRNGCGRCAACEGTLVQGKISRAFSMAEDSNYYWLVCSDLCGSFVAAWRGAAGATYVKANGDPA